MMLEEELLKMMTAYPPFGFMLMVLILSTGLSSLLIIGFTFTRATMFCTMKIDRYFDAAEHKEEAKEKEKKCRE